MMVTFISQCEKNALKKTRRVLDAFANRIGDNTWQTVITEEGLKTVKKMLRQTATKSTAVSCHWIRSRARSQFLWVVGNKSKFDENGVVPVNFTENEISQYTDNYQWNMISVIQYAAAIAGLFHDFGKATVLFQKKIDAKQNTEMFEPYRHEWLSLRLFQGFVANQADKKWLEALSQVERDQVSEYFKDGLDGSVNNYHPIKALSPFAQLVAWLILTHHKLPIYPKWKENSQPTFDDISDWMDRNFDAVWNSHNCKDADQQDRLVENWNFEKGLPYKSMHWRSKVCLIASEANAKLSLQQYQETDWLNHHLFTAHVARLCLMLADHYYSAQEKVTEEWRSPIYTVWANTDKTNGFKQQLDEHLIGVAHHAQMIARSLPKLNASLDSLEKNDVLESNVEKKHKQAFGWQDDARKCSEKLAKSTVSKGFFGINMASTGKGKTLANAKIMYAIGDGTGRKRFCVALGLRTLTLQTGREYRKEIKLNEEELAIVVGGTVVKQLFENQQNQQSAYEYEKTGSESQDELFDPDLTLDYKGSLAKHSLSEWTKQEKNLDKLINAPVLVCTIDHLIPATEGTKGGKQIAPMLRLLTSDLVLDEPDDFGLEDLPALCRLVHWAGLLGSRVLLSTATMPPALAYALFLAYKDGWEQYAKVNIADWKGDISCAWFDEFESKPGEYSDFTQFKSAHEGFVEKRIKNLNACLTVKQKGEIIPVQLESGTIYRCLAQTIQDNIIKLHKNHHQSHDDKNVSIGLVRMANINPLVAVATELLQKDVAVQDTCIHYCVYHSRYPLAVRSHLENKLDRILKRHNPEDIWRHLEIVGKLENSRRQNHIFVVIASPVAEVGRDHDYDWAIVEPSSMRSIIQLAGRVLRHRPLVPLEPNILLLNKNYKALTGTERCFEKPGFEIAGIENENTHDLREILAEDQYKSINAIPRITVPDGCNFTNLTSWCNLVELEHKALTRQLFKGEKPANVWWKNHPQWCGEVQRQQHFRDSPKDEAYYLWITDEYRPARWQWKNENVTPAKFGDLPGVSIDTIQLNSFGTGNDFWFDLDAKTIYAQLVDELNIKTLEEVSRKFGEVRLVEYENRPQEYKYHPNLGLFQEIR
ncbi:MAG: type I-F CRISPR-associated helicase Cas3f [Thermodesulfobacteriota bacterium]|nr:type I-F CRISPR-associated helicase Cas3f [Thermodesulfobacteriota bacterium]